jgi:SAM-dependent methyltransferase
VLDVGCGPGFGCPILKRGGAAHVVGLDEQREMTEYAARRYEAPGITFLAGSALDAHFADGSFDLVTCFEVIEHLARPEPLLNRCLGWLVPGGRLVLSTPNRIVHELMGIRWPFHEREYGYSDLLALLEPIADRRQLTFYGQNPSVIEHFRLRRGRFTPVRSLVPAAVRTLLPRPLLDAVRRAVPRAPRPLLSSDPDLLEACRIVADGVDVCETFIVMLTKAA